MPKLRRGLRGSSYYAYDYTEASKAVPRNFVGAENVSTTSVDDELGYGGNNRDVRSMFVQNMDVLKLSHYRGIKNDLIDVMSVPKLVV